MIKRGWSKLQAIYQRHTDFILLLLLFITFRILTLAAYRPGGLVLDFSDFYWYRSYAEITRQGYYPYYNLWTTYPPLFPVVMIAIYQLSALLPPWEYANLWFTLLLGGFFLLFETGNFILLYLFALKLNLSGSQSDDNTNIPPDSSSLPQSKIQNPKSKIQNALRPCWIYAGLFVPVYTLTGHFESYPIFFFLLSLYLLLENRPYLSAFFTGIGFMIKLIPLILIPSAIQLISHVKYQVQITNYKLQITKLTNPNSKPALEQNDESNIQNPPWIIPFDLPRITIYSLIFITTIVIIATPFYLMNPDLMFGSQQITSARQPWETVWALIDGNYNYGIPPLDRRNTAWTPESTPAPTHIPWLLVTGLFGLVYAVFYTRPINWTSPRNFLAFVAFTLSLFMLWSKGYSPQWLGWPLFFVALLLPNLRGVTYAIILSLTNIIEANFFFIIFPKAHGLFAATVLIRTFLLFVLAIEFLWLIWPLAITPRIIRVRAWGLAIFVVMLFMGAIPGGISLGRHYFEMRRQQSPYSATISRLQNEPVTGALLLNNHLVYDWFYPYLRDHNYTFFMLDDYAPPGGSISEQTTALLNNIAAQTDVLWIYDADASNTTPSEETLAIWLDNRSPAHIQDIDGGRLYLFILK